MEATRAARSNAEDAYQAIRRSIVTVEMPPGSAFTENELVQRVGLGKTPVREALLRLKLERLVLVQARAGYRVAPVSLRDVRETCRLLNVLEAAAVSAVAESPRALPELETLDAACQAAAGDPGSEPDAWVRADWMFHLALARGQDNDLLTETLTRMHQPLLRFRYLALALGVRPAKLPHDHRALLDAIRTQDEGRAKAACESGWTAVEHMLVATLSETESVQNTNVWRSGGDGNSFYLDLVPPGPALPEVFGSGLAAPVERTTTTPTTEEPQWNH